jgi:hypothetical protein
MMRKYSRLGLALALGIVLFVPAPSKASSQEVALVPLDTKEVAKGYHAELLKLRPVVNDKGETIGQISDFIFSRGTCSIFAVISVGDFIGENGHLVAVPFENLKVDDHSDAIILPGASRAALQKLPVFFYTR